MLLLALACLILAMSLGLSFCLGLCTGRVARPLSFLLRVDLLRVGLLRVGLLGVAPLGLARLSLARVLPLVGEEPAVNRSSGFSKLSWNGSQGC